MATTRKTITVSEQQEAWIKSRIASGDFTNDSEYLRDLIRRDQERTEKLAFQQKLITEGIQSGISERGVADIMKAVEAKLGKDGTI